MFRNAAIVLGLILLAGNSAFQYLTLQEAKAAKRAAIYAATVARDADHSAGEASQRAGIACRASLEAIGKLPKGADIWETPTLESAQRSGFCGGADLDNL